MKAISLFSGVGGLDMGFERAGIETVLQAERDPWCLEVLAKHWPETERVTDVRDVFRDTVRTERAGGTERDSIGAESGGGDDREGRRGTDGIDLIYGGFPCQDVSVAGKRAGLDGERSGLWFEFERILSELRPRWAVIENVPGLLSSNKGRDFAVILDGLEDLGYSVGWAVLDAQNFGVPQRRRRVFIVAGATRRSVEQVLSLCESCGGNPETGAATGEGTTGALSAGTLRAGGVNGGNNPGGGYLGDVAQAIAHTLKANTGHAHGLDLDTYVASTLRGRSSSDGVNMPGRGGEEAYGDNLISHTLQAEMYHHGGIPNQTANGDNGFMQATSSGVRRLTPLECERLMGWPDDWTRWTAGGKEIADSHRYRMAGNGVVASVAEWIGHRIVAVDGGLA